MSQTTKTTIITQAELLDLIRTQVPVSRFLHDDEPLGDCPLCGGAYWDERERGYHADGECIGADDRWSGC